MRTVAIVHHRVADYGAWKDAYDGAETMQREAGVRQHAVLRPADDPEMVVVVHVFDSPEAAHAFFDNPELSGVMESAGVDVSSFRIEFLQEELAGSL
jgi:heme-degrading monooxygenase HmoA